MINIEKEKGLKISTQDCHDIFDMAMQAADYNGFISTYDYERALYVYATIYLCPDRKDEIIAKIEESTYLDAWNFILTEGIIDSLLADFTEEINFICGNGEDWYKEYLEYSLSIRGTLNAFQTYSGNLLQEGAKQLVSAQTNPDLKNVYDIANKWGMNNATGEDTEQSLFYDL